VAQRGFPPSSLLGRFSLGKTGSSLTLRLDFFIHEYLEYITAWKSKGKINVVVRCSKRSRRLLLVRSKAYMFQVLALGDDERSFPGRGELVVPSVVLP
jgi:hypothetical protein